MTVFVSDTFAGSDGQTLEAYNPAWAKVAGTTGTAALLAGRVRHTTTTNPSVYYRSDAPAPSADYSVTADLYYAASSSSSSVGICGRMSAAAATMYQARINGNSGFVLGRYINGSTVNLGSYPATLVAGTSYRVRLEMTGDQISVYLDDTLVIGPVTDTNIADAGFVGVRLASTTTQIQIDNLIADDGTAGGGATVSWSEASESTSAGVALTLTGAANWVEQPESTATASQATASAQAAWAEAGEAISVAASAASALAASAAWTESAESVAIGVGLRVSLTAGWVENIDMAALTGAVGTLNSVAIAWTEGGESPAIAAAASIGTIAELAEQSETHAAAVQITARVIPAWVEGSESFAAGLDIAAPQTVEIRWTEEGEAIALAAISTAQVFARAPSGPGYAPQRSEYQLRPAQATGSRAVQINSTRQIAIQKACR